MTHAKQAAEAILAIWERDSRDGSGFSLIEIEGHIDAATAELKQAAEHDMQRLLEWLMEGATVPPATAFTAGLARQCADMVHYNVGACVTNATAELREERDALRSDIERIKSLCRTVRKTGDKYREAITVIEGYCEDDDNQPTRGE